MVAIENIADLRGTKEMNLQDLRINYVSYLLLYNQLYPSTLVSMPAEQEPWHGVTGSTDSWVYTRLQRVGQVLT